MKNIFRTIALTAIMLTTAVSVNAAKKEKAELVTTEYQSNLHCESCVPKIMNSLPYQRGIKDVKVDVPTKVITVKYDPTKSSDKDIIETLANVEIKVEPIKKDK